MATATLTLDGNWQAVGSGIKTITAHSYGVRYALDTSTPADDLVGHMLPKDKDVSMDSSSDTVYVRGTSGEKLTHT